MTVTPEREELLFAEEAVLQTPVLAAVGLHKEIETTAIGDLVRAFAGSGLADRKIGKGHGGIGTNE
jgi:hypothetical protein